MKILIADDEELVRENLRDILRALARDEQLFEAVNGRKLIEKASEIKPDICFVDIRMPGVSGLEAIESLIDDFPDTSWIILSGYSDFEYARKALALGVTEYLLKPSTEDEVEAALLKAAEKRIDAGVIKREKFEYRLSGVINNSSSAEFDDFLMNLESYAAVVYEPSEECARDSFDSYREILHRFRKTLDENPLHDYAGVFTLPDGSPAIIAAGRSPEKLILKLETDFPEMFYGLKKNICSPAVNTLDDLLQFIDKNSTISKTEDSGEAEDSGEVSSRIVRQAEKLVRENYNKPIGLAQIADELNITPNYLSSLFTKYKKTSFTKYITDIRLSAAKEMLDRPGITVKEAAFKLGYMSSRHFTRLFREKYGMPPSDYRK